MNVSSWKNALLGALVSSSIVTGLFYLYTWSAGL
jgi:hypothetical protein